ncbi:MAG: entericidin A/B family lipoprotein [Desulfovermiculus sp.]
MKKAIQGVAGVLLLIALLSACLGCNTIQGLGQDIKKGGEKIEESAD